MKTMTKYEMEMLKDVEDTCNLKYEAGDSWYDLAIYVENITFVQETHYSRSTEFIKNLQNMKETFIWCHVNKIK